MSPERSSASGNPLRLVVAKMWLRSGETCEGAFLKIRPPNIAENLYGFIAPPKFGPAGLASGSPCMPTFEEPFWATARA